MIFSIVHLSLYRLKDIIYFFSSPSSLSSFFLRVFPNLFFLYDIFLLILLFRPLSMPVLLSLFSRAFSFILLFLSQTPPLSLHSRPSVFLHILPPPTILIPLVSLYFSYLNICSFSFFNLCCFAS